MRLDSLTALYSDQLKDLYSAGEQHLHALPQIIEEAASHELQQLLRDLMSDKTEQLERLQQLLSALGETPHGKHCAAMAGLLREAGDLLGPGAEPEVRDAGIIAAAQRIAHYEIAGYGTAQRYADLLSHEQAGRVLERAKEAQGAFDARFTQLATRHINREALGV